MKSARVRPSSFILMTHVIVVRIQIKHGGYTLGLCVYGLRLGFDCFIMNNG